LNERDSGGVRLKRDKPRGILNVRVTDLPVRGYARYSPSDDLAPFIEHFWLIRWDLTAPQVAETVPHPSVHMVLSSPRPAEIVGVMRRRFTATLEGTGRVVGTKFRAGAFRPFVTTPVSAFTGKRFGIADVFGASAATLNQRVIIEEDDVRGIAIIESFLRDRGAVSDERMIVAGRIAERISADRELTRVDRIAAAFGLTPRQLQRLFREYVGVSPKWVIQRYRLLEAAERIADRSIVNWPDLALDLSYADQAHLIRDFKRLVGRTPAEYARQFEPGSASKRRVATS
jgi:AraC-like DNA-binding protein